MSEGLDRHFLERSRYYLVEKLLPKLERCLEELADEEIWWRPNSHSNSAGNLVLHLCGNLGQWILSGPGGAPDTRERSAEFTASGPLTRAELLERLRCTVDDAVRVLEGLDEERLLRSYTVQNQQVSGLDAVLHAVEHFSHHVGQVIYIAKLRKNRDLGLTSLS